jgi:protein-disulfide isomerase
LQEFLQANPDVQVILKDAAFLSKDSLAVGKIMMAARKQKDISELHNALMNRKGQTTEAAVLEMADRMGFDIPRLKEDAASREVNDSIQEVQNLAIELRVEGTPLFIIGHTLISGAPADLQKKFANTTDEIRKNGCDVC